MGFIGPLEDQIAIRSLHETYADAVFRRDTQQWKNCWAEDSIWDLMGHIVEGRDAIVQMWEGAMAGFAFVGFFSQVGEIIIDGNTATGRVFTHEFLENTDGSERRPVGRYDDHYIKQNDQWLYQKRIFQVLRG